MKDQQASSEANNRVSLIIYCIRFTQDRIMMGGGALLNTQACKLMESGGGLSACIGNVVHNYHLHHWHVSPLACFTTERADLTLIMQDRPSAKILCLVTVI